MFGIFNIEDIVNNFAGAERCICGHQRWSHGDLCGHTERLNNNNGQLGEWRCVCASFKLDNLKYAEDLFDRKRQVIAYAEKLKETFNNAESK